MLPRFNQSPERGLGHVVSAPQSRCNRKPRDFDVYIVSSFQFFLTYSCYGVKASWVYQSKEW